LIQAIPALKTHFDEKVLQALLNLVIKQDKKNSGVSGLLLMCELEFDEIRLKKFGNKAKPFVFSDLLSEK